MYTKIFFLLYGSAVWYQVMQQIWYLHMTPVDYCCYYFLEWKFVKIPQFSECFQVKKVQWGSLATSCKRVSDIQSSCKAYELSFFSCGCWQQYSPNFILVSYFHFEMFGIMADIFLSAGICIFSFCIFCEPIISSNNVCIFT